MDVDCSCRNVNKSINEYEHDHHEEQPDIKRFDTSVRTAAKMHTDWLPLFYLLPKIFASRVARNCWSLQRWSSSNTICSCYVIFSYSLLSRYLFPMYSIFSSSVILMFSPFQLSFFFLVLLHQLQCPVSFQLFVLQSHHERLLLSSELQLKLLPLCLYPFSCLCHVCFKCFQLQSPAACWCLAWLCAAKQYMSQPCQEQIHFHSSSFFMEPSPGRYPNCHHQSCMCQADTLLCECWQPPDLLQHQGSKQLWRNLVSGWLW